MEKNHAAVPDLVPLSIPDPLGASFIPVVCQSSTPVMSKYKKVWLADKLFD